MDILFNPWDLGVFALSSPNDVSFYYMKDGKDAYNFEKPELFYSIASDVKCMAWHPDVTGRGHKLIALGQTNGKVALKTVSNKENEPHRNSGLNNRELYERNTRQCNCLAWNMFKPHWLAVGTGSEKSESKNRANSLLIWDVNVNTTVSEYTQNPSAGKSINKENMQMNPYRKPLLEIPGETVNSLAWTHVDSDNNCLIAGINKKHLKIIDIRKMQPSRYQMQSISSKATYGITVDPLFTSRIASYHDSTIVVWDSRNFSKPYITINTQNTVKKIQWSTHHTGMLAVFTQQRDSSYDRSKIDVYDVVDSMNGIDGESGITGYYQSLKRTVRCRTQEDYVCAVAWHPTQHSQLLTCTKKKNFKVCHVPDTKAVSWRMHGDCVVSNGDNSFANINILNQMIGSPTPQRKDKSASCGSLNSIRLPFRHMGSIIQRRADNNYGLLKDNIRKNIELSLEPDNVGLCEMWEWLHVINKLEQDTIKARAPNPSGNSIALSPSWANLRGRQPPILSGPPVRNVKTEYLSGALAMLQKSSDPSLRSTLPEPSTKMSRSCWNGVENSFVHTYTSAARKSILKMTGWTVTPPSGLSTSPSNDTGSSIGRFGAKGLGEMLVNSLMEEPDDKVQVERICAIATWHLDMLLALKVLQSRSMIVKDERDRSKMTSVAIALSGFQGDRTPLLWQKTCTDLQAELRSPYLQMTFAFLVASSGSNLNESAYNKYRTILNNKDIYLKDRVSFACSFLNDIELEKYLYELTEEVHQNVMLEGLLVTGITNGSGVRLLQNYIDRTKDVQTALMAVIQTCDRRILNDRRIVIWKESYCSMLNKWRYFHPRVHFEQFFNEFAQPKKTTPPLYVACNYCSKNISLSAFSAVSQMSALAFTAPVQRGRVGSLDSGLTMQERHKLAASKTEGRTRTLMAGFQNFQNTSPISSCPHCKQPLPRCSVCNMHLGTRRNETDLAHWLSFCMKCRHGGHVQCLSDWFVSQKQCAVSGCNCFCNEELYLPIKDEL